LANEDLYVFQTHKDDRWEIPNEHAIVGRLIASKPDWIIRGLEGELYPCTDSIFKKKYEECK
jgi:hypothetical protein